MSDDHLALSCHQPLTLWRAACEEAECVIIRGRKHLLFTEEMLVRVGSAIEDAAGVRGTYKDVTGEQTAPEHECEECDWKGATPLEAPNPFEPGRTLRACPVCKSVNLSVTVGWIASDGSKA